MSKTLVAFFSASGTTKRTAEDLAAGIGADIYEITPERAYTTADLDWRDQNSRSSVEMKDPASRPKIAGHDANIESYDRIFLGFPIWWYEAPRIIHTFLESYDFTGKTIIPFATSGGSGLGKTAKFLADTCPAANIRDGKLLNGHPSRSELTQWAQEEV